MLLITPVAKIVAHTPLATRKFMMSTAGSMRPPMSKVRATAGPAFGIVRNVCAEPAATLLPAVHPVEEGGDVGRGVAGAGEGVGRGVTFGSPATISSQPGSMTFGFVASDG